MPGGCKSWVCAFVCCVHDVGGRGVGVPGKNGGKMKLVAHLAKPSLQVHFMLFVMSLLEMESSYSV